MLSEKKNTIINQEDTIFLEEELHKTSKPVLHIEIAKKLAYHKNAHLLSQEVKKYDSYCCYEIGDFIYKEYNEPLMVSSKGVEHYNGAVVLKVINKVTYEKFNCEMLEVDYSGGGIFRKYIDYMKKTKTQVLLPSNLEGKAQVSEKIKKEEDPRLNQLPMTDKDIKTLEKNLQLALSKSPKFFGWDNYWQLSKNQVKIEDKKIKEIEKYLLEIKKSVETSSLVSKFFGLNTSDDHFELHCLSLNHILEKKHKKDFVYVSPIGWGKWFLKKVLDSFLHDLPLLAPVAKLPPLEEEEKPEKVLLQTTSLKIYLTQREIFSGGIRIPSALTKELSSCREYIFTDTEDGKKYTLYYYPYYSFFLGLKDFYEQNNVPQGASLTLEKKDINQFNFWLKKSKKKLSVPKVTYDPNKDKFRDSGQELFTFSLPNKIIHLEKDTFTRLYSLYSLRNNKDLKELLILIFKNFALESDSFSLHYLRAYHLIDVLKRTSLEDLELTLLNSPEFIKSDKKKGVFSYQEKIEIEEEVKLEELVEAPPEITVPEEAPPREEVPSKDFPGEVPIEEIPSVSEEIEEKEFVPAVPKRKDEEKIEVEAPSQKEKIKVPKKRKLAKEAEKAPRLRKRERKFIEEKIEIEELKQEALTAIKEKREREEKEELHPKEKKEQLKKSLPTEEPVFGLFADKLKAALDKKKKTKNKK